MNKLIFLICFVLVGCGDKIINKTTIIPNPAKPELFKTWACQFENSPYVASVFIKLNDMQYNEQKSFEEIVCVWVDHNDHNLGTNCDELSIIASFNENGTAEFIIPPEVTVHNKSYTLIDGILTVDSPSPDPNWGNIICH